MTASESGSGWFTFRRGAWALFGAALFTLVAARQVERPEMQQTRGTVRPTIGMGTMDGPYFLTIDFVDGAGRDETTTAFVDHRWEVDEYFSRPEVVLERPLQPADAEWALQKTWWNACRRQYYWLKRLLFG